MPRSSASAAATSIGPTLPISTSPRFDVFPPWHRPDFKEQKGEIHFHTGAVAYLCSAEDKELRGANLSLIWGDEPIKWPNAQAPRSLKSRARTW